MWLKSMFSKLLANTIYVQIRKNSLRLRHMEGKKEREISATRPFTTARLLVGQFQEAQALLRKVIRELGNGGLFRASPVVVIHPLDMVEGGLPEVKERVYKELAASAGARRVFVHVGTPLSDSEVVSVSQGGKGY
jgi:actin-like ATPase involved in cell morphogenesis